MDDPGSYVAAVSSACAFHVRRFWVWWLTVLGIIGIGSMGALAVLLASSTAFPAHVVVVVESGESVQEAAAELARVQVVTHPQLFYYVVRLIDHRRGIQAGTYRFDTPENILQVAQRLVAGDTRTIGVTITLPEGQTVREMGERITHMLPAVSVSDFVTLAKPYEGYLFPDTYNVKEDASADAIVHLLRDNFDTRIASITPDIAASGHTLNEIVTMASLIEKEARTTENRRVVAGILWHRIELHMPLQVDAVFGYIHDRDTYSPTFDDLETDSLYNTYLHQGLPPGPINNPGSNAMEAALHPVRSEYLYYLTDNDGVMRYAKTFAEHKANRAKYLP